jgi:hypothetical protein
LLAVISIPGRRFHEHDTRREAFVSRRGPGTPVSDHPRRGGRRQVRTGASTESPIAAGTHTLQVRVPRLLIFPGLASPPVTFDAATGVRVEFVCHPPKFTQAAWPKYIACLRGRRDRWIELERAR